MYQASGSAAAALADNAGFMVSGRYYRLPNVSVTTSATLGVGTLRLMPKFIPAPVTLDRLGAEITVVGDAASLFRIGIYADSGSLRPGALVLDAGTIAADSATVQTVTISQLLARGWYWFGGAVQNTVGQPTVRVSAQMWEANPVDYFGQPGPATNIHGYSMTGVTGALPGSFTISSANSGMPTIFGRVA